MIRTPPPAWVEALIALLRCPICGRRGSFDGVATACPAGHRWRMPAIDDVHSARPGSS